MNSQVTSAKGRNQEDLCVESKDALQAHAPLNCHVKYFHAAEGVGM
jgi:hypothetical protein